MVKLIRREETRMEEIRTIDPKFIEVSVDFFRTYADRCHHGKEEDILFKNLAEKSLSDEHEKIMNELIEEHIYARKTVANLLNAKDAYNKGNKDSLEDVLKLLKDLIEFYPIHIEKEDKRFFFPCMEYFTKQEQETMLQEFWNFDRKMIHEKYRQIVDDLEGKPEIK